MEIGRIKGQQVEAVDHADDRQKQHIQGKTIPVGRYFDVGIGIRSEQEQQQVEHVDDLAKLQEYIVL